METYKIKDICYYLPKSNLKAGEGLKDGKYPFFTSSDTQSLWINSAIYDDECLIIGTGGSASCNYYNGKFSTSTDNFIISSNRINIRFLYYILRNNDLSLLQEGFHGAGLKHISKDYFGDIEIKVPSLIEQKNLVESLDEITNTISNDNKELIKLDELIKSRFIEMFGTYEKVDLSTLADITMGQSPDSKSYNDNGNGMPFFQGKGDYGDKIAVVAHWTTEPTKVVEGNVVLMSVRAPVGPVNFSPMKCCLGRGLCGINAKEGKTNNEFLYNALNAIQDEIAGKGYGSTFSAITKKDVYEIKIPNAPIELMNKFSKFAQQIDKSKFIIQKRIDLLNELLEKKMDEYFN